MLQICAENVHRQIRYLGHIGKKKHCNFRILGADLIAQQPSIPPFHVVAQDNSIYGIERQQPESGLAISRRNRFIPRLVELLSELLQD